MRRVVNADNSCLFNAMGYNMERSRSVASRLRAVVADTVAADPFTFNEGVLEKDNAAYQSWIRNPDKWGGPIELFVLAKCAFVSFALRECERSPLSSCTRAPAACAALCALVSALHCVELPRSRLTSVRIAAMMAFDGRCRHFKTEIAAYDVRTQRCDTYGSGDGYTTRCYLVYDGLHYDALALQASPGAAEALDVTQVSVTDPCLPQVCLSIICSDSNQLGGVPLHYML